VIGVVILYDVKEIVSRGDDARQVKPRHDPRSTGRPGAVVMGNKETIAPRRAFGG
jgi:hypothetical protein